MHLQGESTKINSSPISFSAQSQLKRLLIIDWIWGSFSSSKLGTCSLKGLTFLQASKAGLIQSCLPSASEVQASGRTQLHTAYSYEALTWRQRIWSTQRRRMEPVRHWGFERRPGANSQGTYSHTEMLSAGNHQYGCNKSRLLESSR